jgi:hypothetical protein
VNLHNLTIWRWWDDPLPGVVWRYEPGMSPAVHPEDLAKAHAMRDALPQGEAVGTLRLRAESGGWIRVMVNARLVKLGHQAAAALVSLRLADDGERGGGSG